MPGSKIPGPTFTSHGLAAEGASVPLVGIEAMPSRRAGPEATGSATRRRRAREDEHGVRRPRGRAPHGALDEHRHLAARHGRVRAVRGRAAPGGDAVAAELLDPGGELGRSTARPRTSPCTPAACRRLRSAAPASAAWERGESAAARGGAVASRQGAARLMRAGGAVVDGDIAVSSVRAAAARSVTTGHGTQHRRPWRRSGMPRSATGMSSRDETMPGRDMAPAPGMRRGPWLPGPLGRDEDGVAGAVVDDRGGAAVASAGVRRRGRPRRPSPRGDAGGRR